MFVALHRTALETAIGGVNKSLRTVVLAVADGLFGRYGSVRADERPFMFSPPLGSLPWPLAPPPISLMVSVAGTTMFTVGKDTVYVV